MRAKRGRSGRAAALLMALAVAGCAESPACLLPSQKPMLVAQLFFGRDVPNRAPVSDAEWSAFAALVIARQFPAGFTVHDGEGEWFDPQTKITSREATKIVLVAADPSGDLGGRLAAVMDAYRRRFDQKSVGLVTRTECAAF
jgi:hypothetical protein